MIFSIISIKFEFGIASIYLNQKSTPVCANFDINIVLDNNQHGGNIPVVIEVEPTLKKCQPNLDKNDNDLVTTSESEYYPLDVCVIAVVILSCGTFIRSLIKSYMLAKVSIVYTMCVVYVCACKIMYVCMYCMCMCIC